MTCRRSSLRSVALDLRERAVTDMGSGDAGDDAVMEYHICDELGLEPVVGQPSSSTPILPKDDAPALRRAIQALRSRDPLAPVSAVDDVDSVGLVASTELDRPTVSEDDSPRGPSSCVVLFLIAERRREVNPANSCDESIVLVRCGRRMLPCRAREEEPGPPSPSHPAVA